MIHYEDYMKNQLDAIKNVEAAFSNRALCEHNLALAKANFSLRLKEAREAGITLSMLSEITGLSPQRLQTLSR